MRDRSCLCGGHRSEKGRREVIYQYVRCRHMVGDKKSENKVGNPRQGRSLRVDECPKRTESVP
jgi:hypothetical protein